MRTFIILGFLAAVANAGVLPGYNYGPDVSGAQQEILVGANGLTGSYIGQGSSWNNAVGGSYSSGGQSNSGSGFISSSSGSGLTNSGGYSSSGSGLTSSLGYSSSGSGIYNNGQYPTTYKIGIDAVDSVPPTVEYSKQFYHFEAPEEAHAEGKVTKQLSNILKKNLQVVFIKAPENNAATNAALQLAKQAIEQKTAIYVLTKQNDAAQLVGKLEQIQENVQTAPEVRFVKYRTAEDVQRAKASIKSQYDNFGGTSENYNGGVAPVLNYASAGKPLRIVVGGSSKTSTGKYGVAGSSSGSTQFFGAGSNNKLGSSISSSQSIGSSNTISASGSTQLFNESASLDSSSNADNLSYLPPKSLKK